MKKVGLFLLASLFSMGVIAQTNPTATSKPAVDPKAQPIRPSGTPMASGTENKVTKKETSTSKNTLKKTGTNKKTTHHVTPVKKTTTPVETKGVSKDDLKK